MAASGHDTHAHHHGSSEHDVDWAALATGAELEGEVLIELLDRAVAVVADQARADASDVRRIIDIGPGPGVGTGALAEQFAAAAVTAVDGSDAMLARLDARMVRLGVAERVRSVQADLPDGLVGLGPAELVWASMVMHHLGDERAALSAIHSTLVPGGLLAIVEFGDPTRFLPDATGTEPPGFQDRLAAAGAAWVGRMREELPEAAASDDYPTMLRGAGFALVADTQLTTHLDAPLGITARTVVMKQLHRMRDQFGATLEPADSAALEALLDADNPNGIMHRPDVFLDGSRHLYLARAIDEGGRSDA